VGRLKVSVQGLSLPMPPLGYATTILPNFPVFCKKLFNQAKSEKVDVSIHDFFMRKK
jgi:hypothetical protein